MKETLYILIFIIVFYVVFAMKDTTLETIEVDGDKILVRKSRNMKASAILLNELINRMYLLRDYLVANVETFPEEYQQYILYMEKNFNRNRTKIFETSLDSNYTSYAVDKGAELVFCLRCKSSGALHRINLLMYVAVHEMAHTACPESGHTPLFNKIFKFMLEQAIILQLYYYEDYSAHHVEYCGMKLYTNILN